MKIKLHIPTEQYGFVEIEAESNPKIEQVIQDSIELYNLARSPKLPSNESYGGEVGLDPKAWRMALDEFLETGELKDGTNLYEKMSHEQKVVMQEIKKAFKRINKEV